MSRSGSLGEVTVGCSEMVQPEELIFWQSEHPTCGALWGGLSCEMSPKLVGTGFFRGLELDNTAMFFLRQWACP